MVAVLVYTAKDKAKKAAETLAKSGLEKSTADGGLEISLSGCLCRERVTFCDFSGAGKCLREEEPS